MGAVRARHSISHSRTNSLETALLHDSLSSNNERPRGLRALFTAQRAVVIFFILSLLLLMRAILLPTGKESHATLDDFSPKPGNLHVVIPASKENANLCKAMLGAAVLGYPSPVIINWHQEFDDRKLVAGGSHLAKISGVYNFLDSLDETHDEDLVLMVDGYDIWFQLRPQVLLDRYFDINRRADERIQQELGQVADRHNIRQDIIFGCQKKCWPWTSHDPACYAMPESTLPSDIYGAQTDSEIDDKENKYGKYRQRYLNSGVGMGTVRAMRKLFELAVILAMKDPNTGSDQHVISHIFGDQELWREAMRRDEAWSPYVKQSVGEQMAGKLYPEKHLEEVRKKAAARPDHNYEFGIGVDYESKLGLNTVFAEDDTEWLTFSNQSQIQEAQKARGIEPATGRLSAGLESDIAKSLPPFWTFSNEEDLPRWANWSDITLFTNVWTGITPAIIHHNAHRHNLKSVREKWWDRVFYLKYARTLLDAYIYAPVTAFARSGYSESSTREWWPYETWKGGARSGSSAVGTLGDENWIRFDDICRDYHREIFRDDKGPWKLPEIH